jgi:hypothetical protein
VRSLAGFLRRDVALTIRLALGLLLCAAGLLGFDADAFEFRAETRIGLGFDPCDFGLERAGGRFLRGALCFLCRSLAQRLCFDRALRLFVLGLLTEMFELVFQTRVGFGADTCDLGLDRARGRCFGGALGVLSGLFAGLLGVALCLLLRAAGLVGVFANALEFGFEPGVGVAADPRDFGLGSGGGHFLCGLPCLTQFSISRPLGLEMRLFLCRSRRLGFLAKAFDLGLDLGFGLGARARDFGGERAGGGFLGGSLGFSGGGLLVDAARVFRLDAHALHFRLDLRVGFLTNAGELRRDPRVGLRFDARDFFGESLRRLLLGGRLHRFGFGLGARHLFGSL